MCSRVMSCFPAFASTSPFMFVKVVIMAGRVPLLSLPLANMCNGAHPHWFTSLAKLLGASAPFSSWFKTSCIPFVFCGSSQHTWTRSLPSLTWVRAS